MRATLVLLLLAATASAEPLPSPVILPVQRLPISFSHAQHMKLEDKIGCGYCHESAATSRRASDLSLPNEATCATCHKIEKGKCASCHPGWDGTGAPPRIVIPAPNLKFNHEVHVSRGQRCASCHPVEAVNLATRAQLPRMPFCLGCHDDKTAPAACTTCHLGDANGRIRTTYPEGQLIPSGTLRGDAHDLRFRLDHARVAKNDERYCATCHARAFCVECHDGVQKPLDFHPNDYVTLHPGDARRATLDCGACHRQQTFCTGCHSRLGVSTDPKTTQYDRVQVSNLGTNRFHLDDTDDHEKNHAVQAMRNIRACAACHRESFCSEGCHENKDPHPVGWASSARCRALYARAGRMCLRCHTSLDKVRECE